MSILITGGAGFIGSNFARYWLNHHPADQVVLLDALTYAGNLENLDTFIDAPNLRFVKGNIRDSEQLDLIFSTESIDRVVHFAAESHVDRSISGPKSFVETNVDGTLTLLEVARQYWTSDQNQRFIHISTDEVYGSLSLDQPPSTETDSYQPNSPYAASKAASDHLVRAYHHTYQLPTVTIHASNNYGPYQFPEKLIPLMILNILDSKPLPVYGDGQNIREWIHVQDTCSAIEAILQDGIVGEIYNVGGDYQCSNIDLVNLLCDLVDNRVNRNQQNSSRQLITFVTDRQGHDRRYALDSTKIQTELGWKSAEPFEAGIQKTVDWYLEHRAWWEKVRSGEYHEYYAVQYENRLKQPWVADE